jgi:hypothetical protein
MSCWLSSIIFKLSVAQFFKTFICNNFIVFLYGYKILIDISFYFWQIVSVFMKIRI